MKKGDIVICFNNEHFVVWTRLTHGKSYILLDSKEGAFGGCLVQVVNDMGFEEYFSIGRFRTLKEIRKEKLEKLE